MYKEGSFDAAKFKETFGLKGTSEGKAYSEGSTTGTKQVGALGTYLTKKDYNRLKDSDKVRDAYSALRGEEAAQKKFEGGKGLSINSLDALFDDLSKGAPKEAAEPKPKDDVLSGTMAESLARNEAYEDYRESGAENRGIVTGESTREEDYMNNYKLNLQKRLTPGTNTKVGSNPVSNIAKDVTGKGAGFGPV